MFGYVKTDTPNMYVKDTILYRSMYCGLCKSIGKTCGQKARLCLNYDLTFLSAFLHNLLDLDVKIEKHRCVVHWIKSRPIAMPDDLSKRIANLNIILAYHKLSDDVIDANKGKIKRSFFKSSYKKAKKQEPKLDEIAKIYYKDLLDYEKTNGDSIDMACDPFGNMMKDIVRELTGDAYCDSLENLSYFLGKWIYLIDALDDFDKDKKKNNFNVFINIYKDVQTKKDLISKYKKEIEEIFADILIIIEDNAKGLKYNFNHDLIDNILFCGLKHQTKMIMENCKCKNTTKF